MNRKINRWEGKHIIVVGAARQGQAAAQFMVSRRADVTVTDRAPLAALSGAVEALKEFPVRWVAGDHPLSLLDQADFVCVSGGADLRQPFLSAARDRGIPLINDTEVFLQEVSAPVIGITGSAGKTTTTTLVGRIANAAAGKKVFVGGNIGTPLLPLVDSIKAEDRVILELSSFQLDLTTVSPHVAAVLNITPNHLDRHGTMADYIHAKRSILKFQTASDWAVLSRDDTNSAALKPDVRGNLATFGFARPFGGEKICVSADSTTVYAQVDGKRETLLPIAEIALPGRHNLSNVMAAAAIALSAGFDADAIRAGVAGFSGVPHRLELAGTIGGVRYINDSIATAPERTMAALRAFDGPMIVLLGGRDKNLPWEDLAALVHQKAKAAICFGEAGSMIAAALENSPENDGRLILRRCEKMADALETAREIAKDGDIVLLSPGGTSYDAYKDFEERGNEFRSWVRSRISNS